MLELYVAYKDYALMMDLVQALDMTLYLRIADEWCLTEHERLIILGAPARSTYYKWVASANAGREILLSLDILARISATLGIYKSLKIIFERDDDGCVWLRAPNNGTLYGEQAPINLMTSGAQDGLMQVRRHLDAWRGGTFSAPLTNEDAEIVPLGPEDVVFVQ